MCFVNFVLGLNNYILITVFICILFVNFVLLLLLCFCKVLVCRSIWFDLICLFWSVWRRGWRVRWFLVLQALAIRVPLKSWSFWRRCGARPGSTETRPVCRACWTSTTPACRLWPSLSCWTPPTPTPTSTGRTLHCFSTSLISLLNLRARNTPQISTLK